MEKWRKWPAIRRPEKEKKRGTQKLHFHSFCGAYYKILTLLNIIIQIYIYIYIMSSSYVRYPPPSSSINLLTSVGPIEVSLWTTELESSSKLWYNLMRYNWFQNAKVTKGVKGVGWQVTPSRSLQEVRFMGRFMGRDGKE